MGEADVMGVLNDAVNRRPDKVVRGVAGDVIEVSVLGCGRDCHPEPDILVDGIRTELKTTGLHLNQTAVVTRFLLTRLRRVHVFLLSTTSQLVAAT